MLSHQKKVWKWKAPKYPFQSNQSLVILFDGLRICKVSTANWSDMDG